MAKRQYPKGKELAKNFVEKLKGYPYFELISQSDVCHIRIDNDEYYLYFKCVTHEGKPYPLEHQRAQLPQRASFDKIKESNIPFLFIGYDVDHDVYVCWEPSKVKPRLNKKTYVSFYSRLSIQESVVEGEIRDELLTNGDKFVLFKSGLTRYSPWQALPKYQRNTIEEERNVPNSTQLASESLKLGVERFCRSIG